MASSHPVQSRTAINALRGVLLTTSCSVILLAEERRQRLKIARAAIDNAKKLHTARVVHNSVSLSESFGRREAYPIELGGDYLTTSNPEGTIRRRRRNGQPSRTSAMAEATQPKQPAAKSSPETSDTPETRQKKWDEWDAARRELSQLSLSGPFSHHELFLRVSMDEMPIDARSGQQRTDENDTAGTEKSSLGVEAHASGPDQEPILKALHSPVSRDAAPQTPAENHRPETSTVLRAAFAGQHSTTQLSNVDPGMKPPSLLADDSRQPESQVSLEDSLVMLDDLVAELKSPGSSQPVNEGQDSAIRLLGRLISSEFLAPQAALLRGLRILQSVVTSRQHAKIPNILDTLRPVCKDICLVAVPAMDCLHAKHDGEGASKLLRHLFESPVWKSENTPHNQRNPWVTRMLMHYWRKTQNFSEIKSIYQLLQDAGIFADGFLSPITQYSIRRRVALTALDAGDDATAKAEMEQLRQLRPKASENDIKLRGRFAIRDASLGNWEAVWPQVQGLTAKGKTGDQYQNVLSWLTKIYCKDHTATEIDAFVQDVIASYGMVLNQPLAFTVIDRHGRSRDMQALVKWLQYCHNAGLEMDQIFFNEVVEKCCKYWSLARVDVVHMLKGVREFMPWIHDPHVAKYSVRGALKDLHKSLPGEDSKEDSFRLVSKLPNTPGDSFTAFERTAFMCMNTWALEDNWPRVYDAFNEASDKGIGFSSRCLRLAVIANINMEGPHSCTATELVGKAHVAGNDVSGALVPLLVARLESGDSVGRLLQEALSQGTHVHDSVYNKAARILTQKGFQEGAIRVCELAAQQNGNGELAYSQFNFASLVYLFTGQRRYDDLRSLVMSFTNKSEWWQGSKECKESLKRAIKAVAKRVARSGPTNREIHEEALMHMNQALAHIKVLRATGQQDRVVLAHEVAGVFKQMDQVLDLNLEAPEEGPVDHRLHSAKISWENPPVRSRNKEQLHEGIHQDGQMRMEQSKSSRNRTELPQPKRARTKELANEPEDMFIVRQSLAGALF
ncbi:hypothetical protein AK830_g2209 [Neonectria ditissima]|uniref:Uncharacterized protein n=1 Tax=Neonectria ditissima TaxID=78410 RepID=A0A0P7B3Q6_9HYPO|nr:hypothetical protein AK830_g2209 [Neonectria ditissima]